MKKIFGLLMFSLFFACAQEKNVKITISNGSTQNRKEVVSIAANQLKGLEKASFIITDNTGKQVPYQLTYDSLVIFPVDLTAGGNISYIVKTGTPDTFQTIVCGRQYPERVDDIAWENDRIAFRTYGPALKATGEQAYGYDVWVKNTETPVVELRYQMELNSETKTKIAELRKSNPEEAKKLANATTYHIDHGNGLDFYKVGPTLGAASSGLLVNDSIQYPYCYDSYKILDNGPLRFTVELEFDSINVANNDNVIEKQIISLDAFSQLNHISISYQNVQQPTPIVTGIVVHAPSNDYQMNPAEGYIAYAEVTDSINGQIYVGAVFPEAVKNAQMVTFSESEKTAKGAEGHVLAFSEYTPGKPYTYYGGAGWSKWGFADSAAWFDYIKQFAQNIKQPLTITIE